MVISLVYNAYLPLHFDEAYYWAWSKHPDISYYDHPPMIAWMLALAGCAGDSEWMIRLVPFVCMALLGFVIWHLADRAFGSQVADTALLFYMLIPIVNIGFFLAVPDAPLNLFWGISLYTAHRAFFPDTKYDSCGVWLAVTGFFFGCALLSKYTAVLLFPALFLTAIFTPNRKWLISKAFLGAIFLALLVFSPVLVWNWQHDWASFTFQFGHGMAAEKIFDSKLLLHFIGSQAGVLNPLLFVGLLYAVVRFLPSNLTSGRLAFFFWPFIFPVLFFAYAAMFKKSAANWVVPAYISGIILLSYWSVRQEWRKWRNAAITLSVLMIMFLRFPLLFPFLPSEIVFISSLHGVPEIMSEIQVDKDTVVWSDGYANASLAAYYINARPLTDTFNQGRISMYDYWRKDPLPKKILYAGAKDEGNNLRQIYEDVKQEGIFTYKTQKKDRTIYVYRAQNP